jgi:hypothetical protein
LLLAKRIKLVNACPNGSAGVFQNLKQLVNDKTKRKINGNIQLASRLQSESSL